MALSCLSINILLLLSTFIFVSVWTMMSAALFSLSSSIANTWPEHITTSYMRLTDNWLLWFQPNASLSIHQRRLDMVTYAEKWAMLLNTEVLYILKSMILTTYFQVKMYQKIRSGAIPCHSPFRTQEKSVEVRSSFTSPLNFHMTKDRYQFIESWQFQPLLLL